VCNVLRSSSVSAMIAMSSANMRATRISPHFTPKLSCFIFSLMKRLNNVGSRHPCLTPDVTGNVSVMISLTHMYT